MSDLLMGLISIMMFYHNFLTIDKIGDCSKIGILISLSFCCVGQGHAVSVLVFFCFISQFLLQLHDDANGVHI